VTVIATGVPQGLGEPVFDRLDADIAHAHDEHHAVKAVEIAPATVRSSSFGSQHRDELTPSGFRSNTAGGMLGASHRGRILWRISR